MPRIDERLDVCCSLLFFLTLNCIKNSLEWISSETKSHFCTIQFVTVQAVKCVQFMFKWKISGHFSATSKRNMTTSNLVFCVEKESPNYSQNANNNGFKSNSSPVLDWMWDCVPPNRNHGSRCQAVANIPKCSMIEDSTGESENWGYFYTISVESAQ